MQITGPSFENFVAITSSRVIFPGVVRYLRGLDEKGGGSILVLSSLNARRRITGGIPVALKLSTAP
jgi:hypothetical protein